MKTNIEYKNGVLYVRVFGVLVGDKVNIFENEIIPIVLSLKTKWVMVNLNRIDLIDSRGVNSLVKVSDVVNRFKGKVVLCEMNDYVKDNLSHTDVFDYCFKSKNEKLAMDVFKI